jgi:hypothetical protein
LTNANNGTNGAIGDPGTAGDPGTPQSQLTETFNDNQYDTYEYINIQTTSGGNGGYGGAGGSAGADGASGGLGEQGNSPTGNTNDGGNPSSTLATSGGTGGDGGIGGAGNKGAEARSYIVNITHSSNTIRVTGPTGSTITAFAGGNGGLGGNSGYDNATGTAKGGQGGAGGNGDKGGSITVNFYNSSSPGTIIFEAPVTVTSGDGGIGGNGGAKMGSNNAGNGGNGGNGGDISIVFNGDIILDHTNFSVISGDGGAPGTLNGSSTQSLGGNGGYNHVNITNDMIIKTTGFLNITKGTTITCYNTAYCLAGGIEFRVGHNLEIKDNQKLTLALSNTNDLVGTDIIYINTILFDPGSEFDTTASVYSYTKSSTTHFYNVKNLDVITKGTWRTAGSYAPDNTTGGNNDFVRLDLSDNSPNDVLLTFGGSSGNVDLGDFNPVVQHNAYLSDPDWTHLSDVPSFEAYRRGELPPAFLTSIYQTKRLNLGRLTLLDQTTGTLNSAISETRADGNSHYISAGNNVKNDPLYDDFAFTAGLRRYYWDVYVDSQATGTPLMAHNYFTADATKVFTQSAGAALVSINQSFNTTMSAIQNVDMYGPSEQVYIGSFIGGETVKAKTGSHVEVDSLSVALTVSKKTEYDFGHLTLGVFGEFGHGNYDTYAFIPRYGEVFGGGDVNHYGGGFFFKTMFSQNTFIEASVRGGGIRNDFSLTKDPWLLNPGIHSNDTNNSYYGAHFGIGHKFEFNEKTNLVGYGRFFWTRTHRDDFVTTFGDHVQLDAVDSSRARVGARLSRSIANNYVQFYIGAAAEQEFDGQITGTYAGDPISNPAKIKGTSGFGEIGLNIMPTDSKNFTINTEVFGYTGQLQGVGGSAAFSFNF